MSSLDRIKKKRQLLNMENSNTTNTDRSMGRISQLRDELRTTGKIDYGYIAPSILDNFSSSKTDIAPVGSKSDLITRRNELKDQIKNYDRKKNEDYWWDDDKGFFPNVGNVLSKLFVDSDSENRYVKDEKYDALVKEYDELNKAIEDNYAATKKYDDGILGTIEKSGDVFVGNAKTGLKGIESTAKKILGGETDTELDLDEKLSQRVSAEATGGEKVYYDVLGSVGRMMPQIVVGNPTGATVMGFANYGGGAYNQAKREGYSEEEATKYGLAIGSLEMATSKALGTFSSVYGKSKLGNASQEVIDKVIPKIIKNKQVRNVLGQFAAEGSEEFLQEYIEGIARDTLLDDKGFLKSTWTNITDPDKFADALYSGLIGGITGSTMAIPSQIDAYRYEKATGRNAETGLTANEQRVVDGEVAKRTEGKNLTKKQIAKIETEVKNELEKGYISTDTIESVLGGDTYNNLKSTRDSKTKIENEIKELEGKKNAEITVKEMEHLKDLREQLKGIDTNTLETDLQGKMGQIIKSDGYLQRSYQEKAKRGQKFTYDASKVTNEFEKAALESASKVMNDTNRSHEFVEPVVKLAKDKGTYYEFTNNAELEKSNYDVKGKQVNGLVAVEENGKKKILINVDSSKALNTIVGHETTHLLEGTTEYQELQDAIFNYAKTQGDFDSRQASLYSLYKDIKGADVNSELTADLVGDYLFTDNNFISELSTQKPTVFQKIRELIDDLVVRFKGTKEEKALREVQNKFKEAYRKNATQTDTDTKYSVSDNQGRTLTKEQQEYFKDSKVRDKNGNLLTMYHGSPNNFTIFDRSRAKASGLYGRGLYFTEYKDLSDLYERDGKTYEVYINSTNPLKIGTRNITKEQLRKFVETVANNEDYSIENYGTYDVDKVMEILNLGDRNDFEVLQDINATAIGDFVETVELFNEVNGTNYDGIEAEDQYVAFYPNQIKNIDNTNPTTDADIRYSLSEKTQRAIDTMGVTTNMKVAGYLTTDGQFIDFSGKYQGARGDQRQMDHREIADIYTDEEYDNAENKYPNMGTATAIMQDFIDDGNIRTNGTGVDISVEPTESQYDKLYDYLEYVQRNNGEVYIDLESETRNRENFEYDSRTSVSKMIKDIKNHYAKYSLSNQNDIAPRNPNLTYGEDVKLQQTIAPLQEEIQTLTETVQELKEQLAPVQEQVSEQVRDEYAPLTEEDLPYLEQQYNEAPKEDIAPPETEENIPVIEDEVTTTRSLEDVRDFDEVGSRKVKAYQYENPEVRPYFQEMARYMLGDLDNSVKGERGFNDQVYYDTNGEQGFYGVTRETTQDIAELLDSKYNYTYADIRKGLEAIIEDHGAENIAVAKRIEFALDKRLREGYVDVAGYEIPANQEYIKLLQDKEMLDYYNNIPIGEAPVENVDIPVGNVSNTKVSESNVPIKEMNTNDSGQGVLDLGTLNKLKAPEGEIKNKYAEPIDLDKAKQLTIEGKEEDLVTKTKKELRKALLGTETQKEFITNVLDNAKNRSMALMNNTDTIRNNELVFGREAGSVINEIIFQKEIDNEADSIAWQNKERQEIKDLGIKARSKESAAVQKYGEKQYINENNEVVAYGDKELASEFSDVATQEKIKNAAKVIRSKYDAYIDNANNVLTKLGFEPIKKRADYMRHFQELNDVFSRYGIPFNAQNMQEHTLPTDINGLTEFWSPQKNYFANMQPRKGMKTTYDAITGIDGYIGGIANLIYHTEDIQRGRAFEELIRETYGEDKGFDNLENLPEELQQARMEKIQDNHLSNYAAWVHEWTNNVAGKKSKIDRSVESMFGRKAFAVLDQARKQVGANMIGFNLSSSLTNLIAPVQAASKTNKLAVLKGTADTIKNIFVKDNFMDNNKFLTARMGTDMLSQNAWQKIQNAGYVFMKGMDWFSSNQIVRSKYYELRAKGMSEQQAHTEAGKFAARIMGDRTKGANAQLYNSKLIGLVTQFQLEVNNQLYSQFYDTYHESKENAQGNALKTAAGMTFTLGQLFALTHLFGQTFEAIAGYNPTFDVVEMIKTAFGWGDDEEEEEKPLSERLKATADQLVDALPYVNTLTGGGRIPVASGIPNLVGVATGGTDDYGNELTLEDELKKLLFLIPPAGGNQVKKTTQGLSMFDEELPVTGSYTDSGNLRFPVEDTLGNRVQAALFGQWANENASNYFDNERQPLKEKQIQEYADLDMPIKDYWKYREGLKEQSTIEEKFEYINGLDVTDEQKNIMINNATGREDPIDMSGYDNFGSYDEFDYATKNPDKYRVIEQIDTFDNFNSYKDDIANIKEQYSEDNGYSTKDRKAAVQQYINSLSLDIPQKIMLEKMAGGYSIKGYMDYMYSYIESLPMTAEEKQAIHNQLFD